MINCAMDPSIHLYRKGYLSIVKCLIAKGHCDVNIKDSSGDTPLYEACR